VKDHLAQFPAFRKYERNGNHIRLSGQNFQYHATSYYCCGPIQDNSMCSLDLALEIQQKGTECTMVIALSLALSFVGEVYFLSHKLNFLIFRYFGVLGVCTWQPASIANEELHPKSSQGHKLTCV
jgi:hypothetical protein